MRTRTLLANGGPGDIIAALGILAVFEIGVGEAKMQGFRRAVVASIATLCCASALAQSTETTDIKIRRLAGLPDETAKGQIQILAIGHLPLSTMLSIVGNRTEAGWVVSYACAMSPHCSPSADQAASTYTLSSSATAEVDQILEKLRTDGEPDGDVPSPNSNFICGGFVVSIDYHDFKHEYRRCGAWGSTLGRLESLMVAPAS